MGKYDNVSTIGLISRFIQLIKRFADQEKLYVKQTVEGSLKTSLPGAVLAIAGLVFLALGGIFCLVTAVLVLNIWFAPWASALIVTAGLLLIGLVLALVGVLKVKKGVTAAKTNLGQVKEDLRWLKKS
jgi:ABC-type transport system involved in cytochrome bd biosynthesis fused ATPase/permease subunit